MKNFFMITKAIINTWKVSFPIACAAGLKFVIVAAVLCAFFALGEPKEALITFDNLWRWGILIITVLFLFVPIIVVLAKGKFKAMARVNVNFQKEWKDAWKTDSSDPFGIL